MNVEVGNGVKIHTNAYKPYNSFSLNSLKPKHQSLRPESNSNCLYLLDKLARYTLRKFPLNPLHARKRFPLGWSGILVGDIQGGRKISRHKRAVIIPIIMITVY